MGSEERVFVGKWIDVIDEKAEGRKTKIFRVISRAGMVEGADAKILLGSVRWFGRWRCYAFFPAEQTVFEKVCLSEIANFCHDQTVAHRLNANSTS